MPAVFSKEACSIFTFSQTSYEHDLKIIRSSYIYKELFIYCCSNNIESNLKSIEASLDTSTSQATLRLKISTSAELLYDVFLKWHILKLKKNELIKNRKSFNINSDQEITKKLKQAYPDLIHNSFALQFYIHTFLRHFDMNEQANRLLVVNVLALMASFLDALERYEEVNPYINKKAFNLNIQKLTIFLFFNWHRSTVEHIIENNFIAPDCRFNLTVSLSKATYNKSQDLYEKCYSILNPNNGLNYFKAYHILASCYQFKTLAQYYLQVNSKKSLENLYFLPEDTFDICKLIEVSDIETAFNHYVIIEIVSQLTSLLMVIKVLLSHFGDLKIEPDDIEAITLNKLLNLYSFILDQLLTFSIKREHSLTEQLNDDSDDINLKLIRAEIRKKIIALVLLKSVYQESLGEESIDNTQNELADEMDSVPLSTTSEQLPTEDAFNELAIIISPKAEPTTKKISPKKQAKEEKTVLKSQTAAKKLLKDLQKHQRHLMRLGLNVSHPLETPPTDLEIQVNNITFKRILNRVGKWFAAIDPDLINSKDGLEAKFLTDFFNYPKYTQKNLGIRAIKPTKETEKSRGSKISDRFPYKLKFLGKYAGKKRFFAEAYTDTTSSPPRHFIFFNAKGNHEQITEVTNNSILSLKEFFSAK